MHVTRNRHWLRALIALLILALTLLLLWRLYLAPDPYAGLVYGNGRIEATEIDVAAKTAGRIEEILVREGDFVTAGQIVARMDTENLMAQLREAEALFHQAESNVAISKSQLVQREAEKQAALALVAQREAELNVARKRYERSASLAGRGATSQQQSDDDFARQQSAIAAVSASKAQVAAADAAIITASAQMAGAESALAGAQASIDRIQADISDSDLKAVRDGRVQYRIAQPGEVIAAGGRVLNLVDLRDVYMTFFLPTSSAGRLALGTEVRIVLDAAPEYVFPAKVSFVADVAQFTPKSVETANEREKLMFRVRAQIPQELLDNYILRVKTGLPGVAFLLDNPNGVWPAHLAVRLP